jgi:hypothetical protein
MVRPVKRTRRPRWLPGGPKKDGAAMAGRRFFALFLLMLLIIAAILVIWYIGSQKTVYSIAVPYLWAG